MQEVELKIGTRFFYNFFDKGLKEIIVVKDNKQNKNQIFRNVCKKCVFKDYKGGCSSLKCLSKYRFDGQSVHFEEVRNE